MIYTKSTTETKKHNQRLTSTGVAIYNFVQHRMCHNNFHLDKNCRNHQSRHAYCIIAHNDLYTLNKLLESIDDTRNDIFLFLDKKWKVSLGELHYPFYSKLISPPQKNRHNIYWGHISQLQAEIKILKLAFESGHYQFYHLISGQDLPIKSQNEIHVFFDNVPEGTNFLGFTGGINADRAISERTTYYIPLIKYYRCKNQYLFRLSSKIRNLSISFQKKFNMKRRFQFETFKKGANWASLSSEFVKYIIENERELISTYRGVPCCDEIYKHTLIWNSSFRNTLYNLEDEFRGCMREIDWKRGGPYTYTIDDLSALLSSDKMFARKFDSRIDKDIIDCICNRYSQSNYIKIL